MKVSLISFTDDALNLLLRTKNTRLSYADDPAGWTEEKKAEHLDYMLNTVRSSWEMVDYVFTIEGVTRNFTHQFVRTRHGSYAQASQRASDVREADVMVPDSINAEPDRQAEDIWDGAVDSAKAAYALLVDRGIPLQDARGILPSNTTTAIMAKFNLRTLSEMARVRLCTRTQGEYQDVFRAMRELVLFHHPWAENFIQVQCVAEGTCAFANYGPKDCPVWVPELDRTEVKRAMKSRFWSIRHEAQPVAKGGKA